jgi:Putative RNA methylase family UPF0020
MTKVTLSDFHTYWAISLLSVECLTKNLHVALSFLCHCRLCKILPGESVCDPMCGGGSIPVEVSFQCSSLLDICACLVLVDSELFFCFIEMLQLNNSMPVIYLKKNQSLF